MSLKKFSKIAAYVHRPRIRCLYDASRSFFGSRRCLHRGNNWRDISVPQRKCSKFVFARKSNGRVTFVPNVECVVGKYVLPSSHVRHFSDIRMPSTAIVKNWVYKPHGLYSNGKSAAMASAWNWPSCPATYTMCHRNYATWDSDWGPDEFHEFTYSADSSCMEHLLLAATNETLGLANEETIKIVAIYDDNMINLSDGKTNGEDYILLNELDGDGSEVNYFQLLSKSTMENDQNYYVVGESEQILNSEDMKKINRYKFLSTEDESTTHESYRRKRHSDQHYHGRSRRHRLCTGSDMNCVEMEKDDESLVARHASSSESRIEASEKNVKMKEHKNHSEKLVAKFVPKWNTSTEEIDSSNYKENETNASGGSIFGNTDIIEIQLSNFDLYENNSENIANSSSESNNSNVNIDDKADLFEYKCGNATSIENNGPRDILQTLNPTNIDPCGSEIIKCIEIVQQQEQCQKEKEEVVKTGMGAEESESNRTKQPDTQGALNLLQRCAANTDCASKVANNVTKSLQLGERNNNVQVRDTVECSTKSSEKETENEMKKSNLSYDQTAKSLKDEFEKLADIGKTLKPQITIPNGGQNLKCNKIVHQKKYQRESVLRGDAVGGETVPTKGEAQHKIQNIPSPLESCVPKMSFKTKTETSTTKSLKLGEIKDNGKRDEINKSYLVKKPFIQDVVEKPRKSIVSSNLKAERTKSMETGAASRANKTNEGNETNKSNVAIDDLLKKKFGNIDHKTDNKRNAKNITILAESKPTHEFQKSKTQNTPSPFERWASNISFKTKTASNANKSVKMAESHDESSSGKINKACIAKNKFMQETVEKAGITEVCTDREAANKSNFANDSEADLLKNKFGNLELKKTENPTDTGKGLKPPIIVPVAVQNIKCQKIVQEQSIKERNAKNVTVLAESEPVREDQVSKTQDAPKPFERCNVASHANKSLKLGTSYDESSSCEINRGHTAEKMFMQETVDKARETIVCNNLKAGGIKSSETKPASKVTKECKGKESTNSIALNGDKTDMLKYQFRNLMLKETEKLTNIPKGLKPASTAPGAGQTIKCNEMVEQEQKQKERIVQDVKVVAESELSKPKELQNGQSLINECASTKNLPKSLKLGKIIHENSRHQMNKVSNTKSYYKPELAEKDRSTFVCTNFKEIRRKSFETEATHKLNKSNEKKESNKSVPNIEKSDLLKFLNLHLRETEKSADTPRRLKPANIVSDAVQTIKCNETVEQGQIQKEKIVKNVTGVLKSDPAKEQETETHNAPSSFEQSVPTKIKSANNTTKSLKLSPSDEKIRENKINNAYNSLDDSKGKSILDQNIIQTDLEQRAETPKILASAEGGQGLEIADGNESNKSVSQVDKADLMKFLHLHLRETQKATETPKRLEPANIVPVAMLTKKCSETVEQGQIQKEKIVKNVTGVIESEPTTEQETATHNAPSPFEQSVPTKIISASDEKIRGNKINKVYSRPDDSIGKSFLDQNIIQTDLEQPPETSKIVASTEESQGAEIADGNESNKSVSHVVDKADLMKFLHLHLRETQKETETPKRLEPANIIPDDMLTKKCSETVEQGEIPKEKIVKNVTGVLESEPAKEQETDSHNTPSVFEQTVPIKMKSASNTTKSLKLSASDEKIKENKINKVYSSPDDSKGKSILEKNIKQTDLEQRAKTPKIFASAEEGEGAEIAEGVEEELDACSISEGLETKTVGSFKEPIREQEVRPANEETKISERILQDMKTSEFKNESKSENISKYVHRKRSSLTKKMEALMFKNPKKIRHLEVGTSNTNSNTNVSIDSEHVDASRADVIPSLIPATPTAQLHENSKETKQYDEYFKTLTTNRFSGPESALKKAMALNTGSGNNMNSNMLPQKVAPARRYNFVNYTRRTDLTRNSIRSSSEQTSPVVDNAGPARQQTSPRLSDRGTVRSVINVQKNKTRAYQQMEPKPLRKPQFQFKNSIKHQYMQVPHKPFIMSDKNVQVKSKPDTNAKEQQSVKLAQKDTNPDSIELKGNTSNKQEKCKKSGIRSDDETFINPMRVCQSKQTVELAPKKAEVPKASTEVTEKTEPSMTSESKEIAGDSMGKVLRISKPNEQQVVETTQTEKSDDVAIPMQSGAQVEPAKNTNSTLQITESPSKALMLIVSRKEEVQKKLIEVKVAKIDAKEKEASRTSRKKTPKTSETLNQRKNMAKLNMLQNLEESGESTVSTKHIALKESIPNTTVPLTQTPLNVKQDTKNSSKEKSTSEEIKCNPIQQAISNTEQNIEAKDTQGGQNQKTCTAVKTAARNMCAHPSDLLKFKAILSLSNADDTSKQNIGHTQTIDELPNTLQLQPQKQQSKAYVKFPLRNVRRSSEAMQLKDEGHEHRPKQFPAMHTEPVGTELMPEELQKRQEQPIQVQRMQLPRPKIKEVQAHEQPYLKFIKQPKIKDQPGRAPELKKEQSERYPQYGKPREIFTTFRGGHTIKKYKEGRPQSKAEESPEPKNSKPGIQNLRDVKSKNDVPKNTKALLRKLTEHMQLNIAENRIKNNIAQFLRDPTGSSFEKNSNADTSDEVKASKGISSKASLDNQRHLYHLPSRNDTFLSKNYLMEIKNRTAKFSTESSKNTSNMSKNMLMLKELNEPRPGTIGLQNAISQIEFPDRNQFPVRSLPTSKIVRNMRQRPFVHQSGARKPIRNPMLMQRNGGQLHSSSMKQNSRETNSSVMVIDNRLLSSVRNRRRSTQSKEHHRSVDSEAIRRQPTTRAGLTYGPLSKNRSSPITRNARINDSRQYKFMFPEPK